MKRRRAAFSLTSGLTRSFPSLSCDILFLLALYILAQGAYTVIGGVRPIPSPLGIAWLAATFAAMLLLSWGKHRTGEQLGNRVLQTEAHVTLIDAYLAGAVLIGLVLNATLGWWWADPLAAVRPRDHGGRNGNGGGDEIIRRFWLDNLQPVRP